MEVAESITVWLPREIRDGLLVGDADDLVATAATATFSELLPANPVSAQALPDMSNLLHLQKQHVRHTTHNLKQRFDWKLIHTFVGGMLVIVNPYALLPHMYAKPVPSKT
jgi:myosin heavy subunit